MDIIFYISLGRLALSDCAALPLGCLLPWFAEDCSLVGAPGWCYLPSPSRKLRRSAVGSLSRSVSLEGLAHCSFALQRHGCSLASMVLDLLEGVQPRASSFPAQSEGHPLKVMVMILRCWRRRSRSATCVHPATVVARWECSSWAAEDNITRHASSRHFGCQREDWAGKQLAQFLVGHEMAAMRTLLSEGSGATWLSCHYRSCIDYIVVPASYVSLDERTLEQIGDAETHSYGFAD
jgi:hypothetical protein